jgi:SAM-dependent methyltransferase
VDYYRHDLALVHARGFGQHADRCAPGILELLAPVKGGLVVELGCGAGAMTRHLLAAGHRVIASDASPAMLGVARSALGREVDLRRITLPDDPLPAADAIVSVGHVISYLPDAAAVDRALVAMAGALRPGGVLAIDICDLAFGQIQPGTDSSGRVGPDWAVITQYTRPAPDRFARDITTFVPDGYGAWRRGSEHHENVLVDTSRIPALLGGHGVAATVGYAFGAAELPPGLRAVTGTKGGAGYPGPGGRHGVTRGQEGGAG